MRKSDIKKEIVMGCSTSSPKTYNRSPIIPLDLAYDEDGNEIIQVPQIPAVQHPPEYYFKDDLKNLLQGVAKMPYADDLRTLVVLSDAACAAFSAPLYFENGDETTINLPIMGFSRFFNGRFFLMGSSQILLKCIPQKTDASVFLENLVRWVSGDRRGLVKVGIMGMSEEDNSILKKNAEVFGFKVKANIDDSDLPKVHCVITTTNFKKIKVIKDLLDQGIGVILCYEPPNETTNEDAYDNFLYEIGMPFSHCELLVGSQSSDFIKSISQNNLRKLSLKGLIAKFEKIIKDKDSIDIGKLDSVITLIRIHCSAITDLYHPLIDLVFTKVSDFIFGLDCVNDTSVCPSIETKISTVLLGEIIDRVSPSNFIGMDLSENFPGKTGNVKLSTYKVEFIPSLGWLSTGLWLPPGITATIDVEKPFNDDVSIQIGSNINSLITESKGATWMRWPVVTLSYPIDQNHMEISSPFGGILYLIFDEKEEHHSTDSNNNKNMQTFTLTISNVCQYPRCSLVNPNEASLSITNTEDDPPTSKDIDSQISNPLENWEQTKNLDIPLGELETETIIFTIPTTVLRDMKDISKFAMRFQSLIRRVFSFTALDSNKQVRVIYDIESFDSSANIDSFPYYVSEEVLKTYQEEAPSKHIYDLLSHAALLSLPEDYFSSEIEKILAALVASAIMIEKYPESDPLAYYEGVPPKLFLDLWAVFNMYEKNAFTISLRKIRSFKHKDLFSINDMWGKFIQEYETVLNVTLPHLKKGINMMHSSTQLKGITTSASLNDFIVSNNEIEVMK